MHVMALRLIIGYNDTNIYIYIQCQIWDIKFGHGTTATASLFHYGTHILNKINPKLAYTWWRHQMETFSELLAICAGNSPIAGYSITDGIQKFWWQINISQFFGLLSVYVYFTQRVSANNFVYNSAFKKMYKNVVCQLSDILFRLHMTSSNGTIFCVNGPVWRQLTGHWWIPLKKRPVTRSLDIDVFFDLCQNKRLSKNSTRRWFESSCSS